MYTACTLWTPPDIQRMLACVSTTLLAFLASGSGVAPPGVASRAAVLSQQQQQHPTASCELSAPTGGRAAAASRARAIHLMADAAATEAAAAAADAETFEFEAEVSKVMDIIINSLYSDKDIFLRELISNASDACDKKRFLSISEDASAGAYEGRVRVTADAKAGTLTIEDNGIGMSKKDLQNNLGKIAQSGTKKFTEALGESGGSSATNLIGQFGVGFYSAFLVASKVTVITKAADGPQLRWESTEVRISSKSRLNLVSISSHSSKNGEESPLSPLSSLPNIPPSTLSPFPNSSPQDTAHTHATAPFSRHFPSTRPNSLSLKSGHQASSYSISADDSESIETTGTRLVLTLKEDADKYAEDFTLRDMLKRYSEFISFPIELWTEKTEYETVPDPEAEVKEGEEPPTKSVPKTTQVWEKVNTAKPLWMRPPKEVSDEEYTEFYKNTFKAYDDAMSHVHFSLEGQVEFRALLFVPSSVPWELSQDMFNEKVHPFLPYVGPRFCQVSGFNSQKQEKSKHLEVGEYTLNPPPNHPSSPSSPPSSPPS